MGKAQKSSKNKQPKHNPLHVDMINANSLEGSEKNPLNKSRPKFAERAKKRDEKNDEEYLDSKISKKILDLAREQQRELEENSDDEYDAFVGEEEPATFEDQSDEMEETEEIELVGDYDGEINLEGLEEADREAMSRFLPDAPRERMTLADIILAKIEEKNTAASITPSSAPKDKANVVAPGGINPKIREVYSKVGLLLSRYKSGKLPKAFKIIPTLSNWEEILYLTQPDKWTPHAYYEATRVFVSNLKSKQSQRFFHYVLLDKVRQDIEDHKKLNPHLFMALKRALYKPASFFKGILFPLCESGTCTLREAVIIGSVITKISIPMLHSGAALLRLAEMEYSGTNSLFIRLLLDKKYALPYKVVDSLVFHFIRFKGEDRLLPVLWHQAFLVFVQRYKQDLTPEQKTALLEVLRVQFHDSIGHEIRRELVNSISRGELLPEAQLAAAAGYEMMD